MRRANNPGPTLTRPSGNFYRMGNHEVADGSLSHSMERSGSGTAPARESAHHVFFWHAPAFRFSLFFRPGAGKSLGHGPRSAMARLSLHQHDGTRSAVRSRTGKS